MMTLKTYNHQFFAYEPVLPTRCDVFESKYIVNTKDTSLHGSRKDVKLTDTTISSVCALCLSDLLCTMLFTQSDTVRSQCVQLYLTRPLAGRLLQLQSSHHSPRWSYSIKQLPLQPNSRTACKQNDFQTLRIIHPTAQHGPNSSPTRLGLRLSSVAYK